MKYTTFTFLLLFLNSLSAFTQDSLITEKLKAQAYNIQLDEGKLSGAGLEFLKNIAQEHAFFLIGENHGIREIPLFTAALFNAFEKQGYQYFATETGPVTARFLQYSATKDDWPDSYSSFLQKYPWSIPFYNLKEECKVLDAVLKNEKTGQDKIWGLDQEFAGGFRLNFKILADRAQDENSKSVAQEYYNKAMHAFEESFINKNPQKSFLLQVQPEDFEKLKSAFAGQTDNLEHIRELEETTNIYKLWYQREGLQSNVLRAEMMKRHFLKYYNEAKKTNPKPKVIFKFGANHIYRGENGLHVYDIGNFISEFSSIEGTSSFHLYVLGKKGTQNAYTPFSKDETDKVKSYDAKKYLDKVDFRPVLDASTDDSWTIFDLRPLRKALFNRSLKKIEPSLEKIIWSYDAILVIPEVHASTNIE